MEIEVCENCKYVIRPKGNKYPGFICSNKVGQAGEFVCVCEEETCRNFQADRNRKQLKLAGSADDSIRYIPLTRGKYAIVDAEDYEELIKHKWYANKNDGKWYACRHEKEKLLLMHRVIINAPREMLVDHINNNGLNNRRSNLRLCNSLQNAHNRSPIVKTSKYKGVSRAKGRRKWRVNIKINDKIIVLGYFDDELEAAKAYDKQAAELFGEFAYLNFPKQK